MSRFWRLATGVAVLLMALFASVFLVLNLTLGEPPLPGVVNRVLLPAIACLVILFSFAGAYLLLSDARKLK